MSTNTRISDLVATQVPQFVRDQHPAFLEFLEAMYEYMEQSESTLSNGKVVERTKNLTNYLDIDQTLDEFAEKFYNEFLHFIPNDVLADRNIILKNAKDFYRSKGTEKSLKFLIRIISGLEPKFYYPKRDILKASDGKWFIQKSLRIHNTKIENVSVTSLSDIENFVGRKITGNTSLSTAVVDRVDRFYEQGTLIDELIITNIIGNFDNNEQIHSVYTENGVTKNIVADIFGGILNTLSIVNGGTNYIVGTYLPFESDSGSGANAIISSVTTGNILGAIVTSGGAGFLANNYFLISGDGTGANAEVLSVLADGSVHPNTYNICTSTLGLEANTTLGNSVYSNINSGNANIAFQDYIGFFTYGPTGPIESVRINDGGSGYSSPPVMDAIANTRVKELGILGRMSISTPGENYAIGDLLLFQDYSGGYGANGYVSNVDANGSITGVSFSANDGFPIGGFGYTQNNLPTVVINTANGTNGEVTVTAVLGSGETITPISSDIGKILSVSILNRGSNYSSAPTINLSNYGDGTAQITTSIIQGVFSYPGRYLNDDGKLSSYNFLQDKDYYQNFSYVIRVKQSLDRYKTAVKNLVHPGGLKLFGEYLLDNSVDNLEVPITTSNTQMTIFSPGTYVYNNSAQTFSMTLLSHGISNGSDIYLEFDANGTNGIYEVINIPNANNFIVSWISNSSNIIGDVLIGKINRKI